MNRSTRMLLMNSGKRKVGVEYEWEPEDHYGPYMPTTYDQPPMEPRSAFYDRQGRRHYESGRYAPMNAYRAPESAYMEPESARRYRRYSDGRFAPRSSYMPMEPWMEPWYEGGDSPRMERDESYEGGYRSQPRGYSGESPRMIGFGREWDNANMNSDATMPRIMEMDRIRGHQSQRGGAYSDQTPRFDQRMAMDWTAEMVNADGTKGPHWSMEETNKLMKQHALDCDPAEFWAVMNSLYSDYCEALRESSASTPEVYVRLARAWIKDKDAVPDKAAAYYTHVVAH